MKSHTIKLIPCWIITTWATEWETGLAYAMPKFDDWGISDRKSLVMIGDVLKIENTSDIAFSEERAIKMLELEKENYTEHLKREVEKKQSKLKNITQHP